MTRLFGVGIVGAGVIGTVHAAAIANLADARLVAIADPDRQAGRTLAEAHGVSFEPSDDDLFARPEIDVVILATPSGLHAEQTTRAAAAGKQVISEKPMAISLAACDHMIAACQAAGVALAVIFQNRFHRDALLLKRAVAAGLLGQPVLANTLVHWHRGQPYYDAGGWRGTWAVDGGGALMNQSIHTIDLLAWIMGPVASVMAEIGTLARQIETEDTASAALRFSGGALGTIQGTTLAASDRPARLEIVGSDGAALLEGGRLTLWDAATPLDEAALLTPVELAATAHPAPDEALGAGHTRQLRAIFQALQTGSQPPVSGAEARQAVAIILAIYESARTGQRFAVAPALR